MDRPHPSSRLRGHAVRSGPGTVQVPDGHGEERRPPGWSLARRIVVPALALLAIVAVVLLAWQLRQLLILTFISLLLAAGLHDPVAWLERRGLPRVAAVAIPFLALAAVIATLVVLIFPPLVTQAAALVEELPEIVDGVGATLVGTVDRLAGSGAGREVVDQLTAELEALQPDLGRIAMLPLTLFETLIAIGTALFLSVLLLVERDTAAGWFLQFVDERDRDGVATIGRTVLRKLGAYVRGQLIVMSVVGVATTAAMLVLGVPFALPLGVLAFATEAIPIVGPFIAAVPIVAVAFLDSPVTGALMLAWFVIVQQAEGWLLTPLVQGKVLSLSPMVVLLAVFAGGTLAGIIGAVIAVPLVAVADVLIRDVVIPLRTGQPVAPSNGETGTDDEAGPEGATG